MNGDARVAWAQATVADGDEIFDGKTMTKDPTAHGAIQFENGVASHIVLNNLHDHMAVCEDGMIGVFHSNRPGSR